MRVLLRSAVVMAAGMLASTAAMAGPKWDIGEDAWMKMSALGQVFYSYVNGATDEEDFYVRRARLIISGQIMDGVKVFAETDCPNLGKTGASSSMILQDAWVDVRLAEGHWVQGGLILLPFSFENKSSATSLLGLDYNTETIKLVNQHIWRDVGVEAHGCVADRVAYRVGLFDGYESASGADKNPGADLRFTGHLAVNVIGKVEKGDWFYSQNRLGKEKYLAVGAGFDYQGDATTAVLAEGEDPVISDNKAWVVDFQSSFGLADKLSLLVNGAFYNWDNEEFNGNTAFVEAGLMYRKAMLTAKYSLQDRDEGVSVSDYTAGLHYFLKDHEARAGIEVRVGDSPEMILVGAQFML